MTVLLALFGGTALLLYGIRLSGDSMQRSLGGRLRQLLTVMSRTRMSAVVSGALVTAILQSSAATTLMLIGFVSAGLMAFRQTLGVILGADIGTTLTVQLIAFRITDYALLLVGVGFLVTFVARRSPSRYRPIASDSSDMHRQVFFERRQRPPADLGMARAFVVPQPPARFLVERRQQVEADVGRLVVRRIGAGDVVAQRTERRLARQWAELFAEGEGGGVPSRQPPGGN